MTTSGTVAAPVLLERLSARVPPIPVDFDNTPSLAAAEVNNASSPVVPRRSELWLEPVDIETATKFDEAKLSDRVDPGEVIAEVDHEESSKR